MAIQRANILYPVVTTTVDNDAGGDIRLLSDTAATGTANQDCDFTHTQDNVHRTFDPLTTGVTANNDPLTLQRLGWALRLTDDMTPPDDDTNCNAFLNSGTLVVDLYVSLDQSGGTYTAGSYTPQFEVSLWSYDPSANTGSLIASGANSSVTWDYTPATGDLGTFKTVPVSINISSDYEFPQGEILMMQCGFNTGTVPNPALGTATWTSVLRIDNTGNFNLDFASGQNIHVTCDLSDTVTGVGTTASGSLNVGISRTTTGVGTTSFTKAVTATKTATVTGVGTISHQKAITLGTFTITGVGTVSARACMDTEDIPTGGGAPITNNFIFPIFD